MFPLCASFTSVSRIPRTRLRIPQQATGRLGAKTNLRQRAFRVKFTRNGQSDGAVLPRARLRWHEAKSACKGEGRFQIWRGTITGLTNRNVWQLTTSRDFDRRSRFKRQSCKAHERASLPCSRRDQRRSSPTCTDVRMENIAFN